MPYWPAICTGCIDGTVRSHERRPCPASAPAPTAAGAFASDSPRPRLPDAGQAATTQARPARSPDRAATTTRRAAGAATQTAAQTGTGPTDFADVGDHRSADQRRHPGRHAVAGDGAAPCAGADGLSRPAGVRAG